MADEKDPKGKVFKKKDIDLWRAVTRDVERLSDAEYQEAEDDTIEGSQKQVVTERVVVSRKKTDIKQGGRSSQLDRRTEERLRRGQMKIEASIDLHGFSQAEAHEALGAFIQQCYAQGKRCVLVITGKGRVGEGVLRRNVPEWLVQGVLRGIVLKAYPAQPKDGGSGALYVYLRRQR